MTDERHKRQTVAAVIDQFVQGPSEREFSELPGDIVKALDALDTSHMAKALVVDETKGAVFCDVNDGREVLRIAPGGDFFVKGRLVVKDEAVATAFIDWAKSNILDESGNVDDGEIKPSVPAARPGKK